mgnify:FL=1
MTKEGMGDEAMKKSLFYRAKKMPPSAQIMLLFAVEGVFLQYITSINGFGLNLYATNMGATDSQIGIIQMVPNIVACAALLPLGILAGLVLHLPAFWIYIFLKIDQIMKCVWCVLRLNSGKWIKKIESYAE